MLLWSGAVRMAWAPDYEWGMSEGLFEERLRTRSELWGVAARGAESAAMTFAITGDRLKEDPRFVEWLVKIQRYGAAPGDLVTFSRVWFSTDARSALPAIQVPAAVLVRGGWPANLIEESTWTADQIPGSQVISLPGDDDDPYLGDITRVAQTVERFVASIRDEEAVFARVLATVLFTDIVGSTDRASAHGDRE